MSQRDLDTDGLHHLLSRVQDGVVARRQLIELGATDSDLARMVRRRELTRVHPGVFVEHTGPLTAAQRAWAAVLVHWPAALARESALPDPPPGPVHVAIDLRRSVRPVPGVVAHRTADLAARTAPLSAPPRIRLEHAVLDVVAGLPPGAALHRLAEASRTRRTSPDRIREVLLQRRGLRGRALLLDLLGDLELGTCSVLEREYLNRVERAHRLPSGTRQARAGADGRRVYRDVLYEAAGLVVELDGRAHHDNAATRDSDSRRDLAAAVDTDLRTVRLTYAQVLDRGCETAASLAALLARGGWDGSPARCPRCRSTRDPRAPGAWGSRVDRLSGR